MDIKPIENYWLCVLPNNNPIMGTLSNDEHRSKYEAERITALNWVTLKNEGWQCLKCNINFTIEKP